MALDKTDKLYKKAFCDSEKLPDSLQWKKDDAWMAFNGKRRGKTLRTVLFSSAAAVIVLLLIVFMVQQQIEPEITNTYYDELTENQKRRKLKEMELGMSGKTVYKDYCMNCYELLPMQETLPDFRRSLEIYDELYY